MVSDQISLNIVCVSSCLWKVLFDKKWGKNERGSGCAERELDKKAYHRSLETLWTTTTAQTKPVLYKMQAKMGLESHLYEYRRLLLISH